MVTFEPSPLAGAADALAEAAGASLGLDEFELEFEFPPHAVRADVITSIVEIPARTRFILFILCLPFILIPRFCVTAYIIIEPIVLRHKEPIIG
jgi:hypothetical protein